MVQIESQKRGMISLAEYKTIKASQVRIAAERFYVLLEDGRELGIPYDWYWRLAEATPEQLNNWRLIAEGKGFFGRIWMRICRCWGCWMGGGRLRDWNSSCANQLRPEKLLHLTS